MKLATPATILPVLLMLIGTAACTTGTVPPQTPAQPPDPATCGGERYKPFIGQKSPRISVPAGTPARHVKSGDPVTMDLNPSRVNFEYSRDGILIGVTCG